MPRQIYAPVADTPASYAREPAGIHPPLDFPGYKSTALRHPKQPLVHLPQGITEVTGPALTACSTLTGASPGSLLVQVRLPTATGSTV